MMEIKELKSPFTYGWVNIEKQKPMCPGRYLTTCKIGIQSLVCILYFNGDNFLEEEVTHWMPLPLPADI